MTHAITDNSRGWRCSCGEWVQTRSDELRALTRERHDSLNWRKLARKCWDEAAGLPGSRLVQAVIAFRLATNSGLKEAVDAIRAAVPEAPQVGQGPGR